MTLLGIGGLLGIAVVLLAGAPVVLTRGDWRVRHPHAALAAWHMTLLGGAACLAATLVWALASATTSGTSSGSSAIEFQPAVIVLFGWAGLAGLGGVIGIVLTRAEPMAEADRRLRAEFALLASRADADAYRGIDIVVVPSDTPVALSVPGPEPLIVVASALADALSERQLRAVVEHERAHLVQHHGLISRLAQLGGACFAFVPASRELERSTRMLIELIADDTAARNAGAVHLANALARVGELTGEETLLLRARRVAERPPHGSLSGSRRLRRISAQLAAAEHWL